MSSCVKSIVASPTILVWICGSFHIVGRLLDLDLDLSIVVSPIRSSVICTELKSTNLVWKFFPYKRCGFTNNVGIGKGMWSRCTTSLSQHHPWSSG